MFLIGRFPSPIFCINMKYTRVTHFMSWLSSEDVARRMWLEVAHLLMGWRAKRPHWLKPLKLSHQSLRGFSQWLDLHVHVTAVSDLASGVGIYVHVDSIVCVCVSKEQEPATLSIIKSYGMYIIIYIYICVHFERVVHSARAPRTESRVWLQVNQQTHTAPGIARCLVSKPSLVQSERTTIRISVEIYTMQM